MRAAGERDKAAGPKRPRIGIFGKAFVATVVSIVAGSIAASAISICFTWGYFIHPTARFIVVEICGSAVLSAFLVGAYGLVPILGAFLLLAKLAPCDGRGVRFILSSGVMIVVTYAAMMHLKGWWFAPEFVVPVLGGTATGVLSGRYLARI